MHALHTILIIYHDINFLRKGKKVKKLTLWWFLRNYLSPDATLKPKHASWWSLNIVSHY